MSLVFRVAIVGIVTTIAATAGTVSIQPEIRGTIPGTNFTLEIDVLGIPDLYAFEFDIDFDPAVLTAVSINEGGFLSSGGGTTFFIPGIIDDVGGTIVATADSLIGAISGVNGNGTLAIIEFMALDVGVSPITISNVQLLDSSLNPLNTRITNGTTTVLAVPEPNTFFLIGFLFSFQVLAKKLFTTRRPKFHFSRNLLQPPALHCPKHVAPYHEIRCDPPPGYRRSGREAISVPRGFKVLPKYPSRCAPLLGWQGPRAALNPRS